MGMFDLVNDLFNTDLKIRNYRGNNIRPIDVYNPKTIGNMMNNYLGNKYNNVYSSLQLVNPNNINVPIHSLRLLMFRDYELMDQDPIIHSALDLFSEEATSKNEFGKVLKIKSGNSKIYKSLENLFEEVLNVEFNLQMWIRQFAKYGDHFMKLNIVDKLGVVDVVQIPVYDIIRLEVTDRETGKTDLKFKVEGQKYRGILEDYEVVHFRLLNDLNYLPYGKSTIEGGRRIWKQLNLMEDAMLIHRIMRAPQKRVFYIDTGNLGVNEIPTFMNNVISQMKKVPFMDQETGEYNLQYNMQNITEDFYMPTRDGQSNNKIETLEGLDYNSIDDINYLRAKLLSSLRIPKAWLGFEEDAGSKSLLAAEDVRFARTIERIQKVVISELIKIAKLHLFIQGFDEVNDLNDFSLELVNPSIVYEQERIELWKNRNELAESIKNGGMLSEEWIYKNIFGLTDTDIETQRTLALEDVKRKYRYSQILEQGNDPMVSQQHTDGMTAKKINAPDEVTYDPTAQQAAGMMGGMGDPGGAQEVSDGELGIDPNNGGDQNPEGSNYQTDDSNYGRDPLGADELENSTKQDKKLKTDYQGGSPLATEDKNVKVFNVLGEKIEVFMPKSILD